MNFANICRKVPEPLAKSFSPVSEMMDWQIKTHMLQSFDFDLPYQKRSLSQPTETSQHSFKTVLEQYSKARLALSKRVASRNISKLSRIEEILHCRLDRLLLYRPTNQNEALQYTQFLLLNMEQLGEDHSDEIMRRISTLIKHSNTWTGT